ncbi:hypothetical protein, partial [uncultured Desulfovibrio sp.]|uniref:hypothetical protein n=1 Tax=uncultured Desulfovibrio sp. TaxID=167968 RepID=UPI002615E8A0
GYDFAFGDRAPQDPACAYAFSLDLPRALREVIRVEYEGRATILERELGRNNLPKTLELRVSLPSKIRRRRRHDRIACGPGRVEDAALVLVEAPPRRRGDLERLLAAPFAGREAPSLLNLSVSGACLLAGESIRQKLMAAQERYLLSFVPCTPGRAARPLVFLGRKVGVYPRPEGSAALRIRFCDELDAGTPGEELRWLNIERNGSAALPRVFRHWEAMDAEAAKLAAREAEQAALATAEENAAGEGAVTPGVLPVSFPDEEP